MWDAEYEDGGMPRQEGCRIWGRHNRMGTGHEEWLTGGMKDMSKTANVISIFLSPKRIYNSYRILSNLPMSFIPVTFTLESRKRMTVLYWQHSELFIDSQRWALSPLNAKALAV